MRRGQAQLLAWLAWLGLLLAGGYYRQYLAGWQGWPLLAALAVLLVLFLASFMDKTPETATCLHGHDHGPRPSWPQTLAHWSPLLIFLALGPVSLAGVSAGGGLEQAAAAQDAPSAEPDLPELEPAPGVEMVEPGDQGQAGQEGALKVNLLSLFSLMKDGGLSSPRVEVEGRVHFLSPLEREKVSRALGVKGIEVVLYRYQIICCAADAQPIAVILQGGLPEGLANHDWARVRGVAQRQQSKRKLPVLSLSVEELVKISPPAQPYLMLW